MTVAILQNLRSSTSSSPWPTARMLTDASLSLLVSPEDRQLTLSDVRRDITQHRDGFERSLLTFGGLLFRGFPIDSTAAFETLIAAIDTNTVPYAQGLSTRSRVRNRIYNSTDYPAHEVLALHNERSYTIHPPSKVFFYSDITAQIERGDVLVLDHLLVAHGRMPFEGKRRTRVAMTA